MGASQEPSQQPPLLMVVPSAGAARDGDVFIVDQKLLAGWKFYAEQWPGRTAFIFREIDPKSLTFGEKCRREDLPGDIEFVGSTTEIPDRLVEAASVMLAGGDNFDSFGLAAQAQRLNTALCYSIEYTLATRLRIEWEQPQSIPRKVRRSLWLIAKERNRRAAFRAAAALQANGVPATEAYRDVSRNILTYFDTRLHRAMVATDAQIADKTAHLRANAPLRLAFTGRLEPLKGAHHLIPVARHLLEMGVDFRFDIYGTGSLQAGMETELARDPRLGAAVQIHRPIDFSTELVPWLRQSVDLFVCCHVQGDPSCTYAETLGCGVPIVGYDNEAWAGMQRLGAFGWKVRMGDQRALAAQIATLDKDRTALADAMTRARDFGREHCFETAFVARVRHLAELAGVAPADDSTDRKKKVAEA